MAIRKETDVHKIIERGNITRSIWPGKNTLTDHKYVNLYLRKGRFGGCFDAWGVMNRRYTNWYQNEMVIANTVLIHTDHYSTGSYGLNHQFPVARLVWLDDCPEVIDTILQHW